jgi:hypothetical protein
MLLLCRRAVKHCKTLHSEVQVLYCIVTVLNATLTGFTTVVATTIDTAASIGKDMQVCGHSPRLHVCHSGRRRPQNLLLNRTAQYSISVRTRCCLSRSVYS